MIILSFTHASKDASEFRIDSAVATIDSERFQAHASEVCRLALVLDGSIHPEYSSKARYLIDRLIQIDTELEELVGAAKALIVESRNYQRPRPAPEYAETPPQPGLDIRPFSDGRRLD
jgi:hypothetical protein